MYKEVSEKLEPQSVARHMFQCNSLTLKELQSIQSKRCESVKAAERLLDVVMDQSSTVFGFFMNALKDSGQKNVYDIIVTDSYKGKTFITPAAILALVLDFVVAEKRHHGTLTERTDEKAISSFLQLF